jgi:hypothetical protein
MIQKGIDLFTTYQFIKRLVLPFNKWKAFELGIIDAEGNVLRPRETLERQEDKDSWGYFDILAANIKKLLGKVPGGKSAIASYAAAFMLLREDIDPEDAEQVRIAWQEALVIAEDMGGVTNTSSSGAVAGTTGEPIVRKKPNLLKRTKIQEVTNGVAGGAIAGLGVGPQGDAFVDIDGDGISDDTDDGPQDRIHKKIQRIIKLARKGKIYDPSTGSS